LPWDDSLLRERVLSFLHPSQRLLDLGAGAGILPQMDFRRHADWIAGVDPDERVLTNPYLHDARVGYGEDIPYPDSSLVATS
jgi:hypothetical protein